MISVLLPVVDDSMHNCDLKAMIEIPLQERRVKQYLLSYEPPTKLIVLQLASLGWFQILFHVPWNRLLWNKTVKKQRREFFEFSHCSFVTLISRFQETEPSTCSARFS